MQSMSVQSGPGEQGHGGYGFGVCRARDAVGFGPCLVHCEIFSEHCSIFVCLW